MILKIQLFTQGPAGSYTFSSSTACPLETNSSSNHYWPKALLSKGSGRQQATH